MKNYLSLMLVTLLSTVFSSTYAQEWNLYKSQGGVDFFYAYADCEMQKGFDQRRMLFKYVNNTNHSVQISFDQEIYYNGSCMNCDQVGLPEYHQSFELDANEVRQGTCDLYEQQSNYLMVKFLNVANRQAVLTQFELRNINVNPMKDEE